MNKKEIAVAMQNAIALKQVAFAEAFPSKKPKPPRKPQPATTKPTKPKTPH